MFISVVLPAPFSPTQRMDLAAAHREVDVVVRHAPGPGLGDVAHLDGEGAASRRSPSASVHCGLRSPAASIRRRARTGCRRRLAVYCAHQASEHDQREDVGQPAEQVRREAECIGVVGRRSPGRARRSGRRRTAPRASICRRSSPPGRYSHVHRSYWGRTCSRGRSRGKRRPRPESSPLAITAP